MTKGMLYIFDADSTLRRCTVKGQFCPNAPDQWEPIPWMQTRLSKIDWSTNQFAIVSNQGGIAHGYLTETLAMSMLVDLAVLMTGFAPKDGAIVICPHATKAGCACRKPNPSMIFSALNVFDQSPDDALFVGDLDTDRTAAERAGVPFMWAWDFCGIERAEWARLVDGE